MHRYDTCSQNCSFPEGTIGLSVSLTASPCNEPYSFNVDPGDGTGVITGVPITGTCDTSQNPSVFTGSGSTTHLYADESSGALNVVFTVYDGSNSAIATSTIQLTVTEGDTMTGQGININFKPGQQFTKQLATFTDTGSNGGYTAPVSDMFPTVDWGDGSPPGSTLDGTVSVSGGNGTFTVTGTHTYASAGPWLITITLQDDQPGTALPKTHAKASVRTFTASPTTNVDAGSTVSYQGSGFDGSGTPITIGWDDGIDPVQNTTLSATTTFSGNQTAFFGHPTSDSNTACTAKLTAMQDGITDSLDIQGVQDQVILADRYLARTSTPAGPVQPPDYVCHGESFGASQPPDIMTDVLRAGYVFPQGAEAVIAAQDFTGSGGNGGVVPVNGYMAGGRVAIQGEIGVARGATLCLPMNMGPGGATARGSMTIPMSPTGPFQAGAIGKGCQQTAPNGTGVEFIDKTTCATYSQIGPGTVNGFTASGQMCSQGSLTVNGNILLNGGVLYVRGNLIVKGIVHGRGAILVNGGTIILAARLSSWQPDDVYLLEGGGDIDILNVG